MKKVYNVTLATPIGKRFGVFEVKRKGDKIWGILSILNHSLPFNGEINEKNECEIEGTLKTLIKTICYSAKGLITDTLVDLTLNGGENTFLLSGLSVEIKSVPI